MSGSGAIGRIPSGPAPSSAWTRGPHPRLPACLFLGSHPRHDQEDHLLATTEQLYPGVQNDTGAQNDTGVQTETAILSSETGMPETESAAQSDTGARSSRLRTGMYGMNFLAPRTPGVIDPVGASFSVGGVSFSDDQAAVQETLPEQTALPEQTLPEPRKMRLAALLRQNAVPGRGIAERNHLEGEIARLEREIARTEP